MAQKNTLNTVDDATKQSRRKIISEFVRDADYNESFIHRTIGKCIVISWAGRKQWSVSLNGNHKIVVHSIDQICQAIEDIKAS